MIGWRCDAVGTSGPLWQRVARVDRTALFDGSVVAVTKQCQLVGYRGDGLVAIAVFPIVFLFGLFIIVAIFRPFQLAV